MISMQRYRSVNKAFVGAMLVLAVFFVLLSFLCGLGPAKAPAAFVEGLSPGADVTDTALLDTVNSTLNQEQMFDLVQDVLRKLHSTLGFVLFGLSAAGLAACFIAAVPVIQPTPVLARVRLDS